MTDNGVQSRLERAETLLVSLVAGAKSKRRAESYGKLAQVLRERVNQRDNNFHIKSIAAASASIGGPSKQTIQNKPGADFKALITAFAEVHGGSTRARLPAVSYEQDLAKRISAAIPDAQLRAEIMLIMAESRSWKRQIDILRASTSRGMVIRLSGDDRSASPMIGKSDVSLTEVELASIQSFIDFEGLSHNGWTTDTDGRIVNEVGREIAKVGFMSGLRKVLSRAGD